MRDLLVAFVVFASLPVILFQPFAGVLMWTWISLMNPHRLTWGFAYDFPFAKIVGAVTLLAALNPAAPKRLPLTRETVVQIFFLSWMLLTTLFAQNQVDAWEQWDKVMKVQIIVFVTIVLLTTRERLDWLIWMIVLSIGFYGVKGGIFTIAGGGVHHVNGPSGSFIDGGNHLGMALVMVIPLMRYLQHVSKSWWVRAGLTTSMLLTAIATLGTQSRGAVLGLCATMMFLVLKTRRKVLLALLAVLLIPLTFALMPQEWFQRMETIRDFRQDGSAMGRINAWWFAVRLASDRPLGGGYECFVPELFAIYAPDPTDVHDAHSIYFEVLGEHGFVGLSLFLTLAVLTWRSCSRLKRASRRDPETMWISDLAGMIQVSLVGYAVTGAFIGLAYFDLYYTLIALVVVAKLILREEMEVRTAASEMDWDKPLVAVSR